MEAAKKSIPEFLTGGGEMGDRIRNFDWTTSPLGPPEQWEQSLKTCVRIMLRSSQPIWIGWGKQLIKLYNDPYIDIVRGKHPIALGQPASVVWKDIWGDIEPLLSQAMQHDEGTYVESQLLIMERSGYPEETYYTFSYTPVLGDDGKPAGIICYNTADTDRIINKRSLDTLNKLSNYTSGCNSETETFEKASLALDENQYDFPFSILYTVHPDHLAFAASSVIKKGHPAAPEKIPLNENTHWRIREVLESKEPLLLENIGDIFHGLPAGKWEMPPNKAMVIPITLQGKENPSAMLIAAINPYRQLDDKYLNFLRLLIDQLEQALFNVHIIEEERNRIESLQELDKAKTIFFSNISHEFRTPLTLMLGTLEEILNEKKPAAENIERIQVTHRNAMRLLKLVNTLLEFSRIESGRQQATYTPSDLGVYTKELASNFRSVMEKAGLHLVVNTVKLPQKVYIDRQMWEKIVFNLLSNAFKYTLEGSITVSISFNDTHALLDVSDTGVGIPEKELPHMFERFHRVQHSAGRTFEGTGIGLSLIKELVHLHGGTIGVQSEPGKGSTFTVAIPFGKDHLPAARVSEHEQTIAEEISNLYVDEAIGLLDSVRLRDPADNSPEIQKTSAQPVVLIVDDNADMCQHIQSLIGEKYKTITAANGLDALQQIREKSPSLILSDIMMPVMDGIELLKAVKQDPQTQNIPVILITARAGEESKIEGYVTGADDYLVKPFSAKELVARIHSQIALSKKRSTIEKQLHGIFEQAPSATLILKGPEFVMELVNERALQIMNKTREETIGKKFRDVSPELEAQGYFDLLTMVYNTGQRFIAEEAPVSFIQEGNQTDMFVKYVFQPLRDEDDQIIGIMIVGDDVSTQVEARKKIEEANAKLANSKEQLEVTFTNVPSGIYQLTAEGRIEYINKRGAELLGYQTAEEALTNPELLQFREHLRKRFLMLDENGEELPIQKGSVQRAMATGETAEMITQFIDRQTGIASWILSRSTPLFNEKGELSSVLTTATDITASKQAENDLRESEVRFRTLAESLPQMVWMRSPDGKLEYASKDWEIYSGMQASGKNWKAMVHPEDWHGVMSSWEEHVQNGTSFRYEVRLKNKSGEYRWHYAVGEPMKDQAGKVVKWIGALTDMHDQKTFSEKLEKEVALRTEELVKANRDLESFNYIASHDLQEPLRKIQIFIDRISHNDNPETSKVYYEKINASAHRMRQLIESVLAYSRLSTTGAEHVKVDLDKVLDEVLSDCDLLIKDKRAVVTRDKLPVVRANHFQMHQVFSNLITNSLKFSRQKTHIQVAAKVVNKEDITAPVGEGGKQKSNRREKYYQLTFSDNGIGFDPKYKEQIFLLFQRLHGKDEYSGTGIGLSIVKKIIEQHHGFIDVESEEGKGATFKIWLPK